VDLEIFSSEPGAPKWYFGELYFLINKIKKHPKNRNWNDQNVYLNSLLQNDPFVVERFFETMEIWHV
jgi:hypothetical protein